MSSILEAPTESFGISTCILEDLLLTVLVTECLTLQRFEGSSLAEYGSTPTFLAGIVGMAGLVVQRDKIERKVGGMCLEYLIRMHYPTQDRHIESELIGRSELQKLVC